MPLSRPVRLAWRDCLRDGSGSLVSLTNAPSRIEISRSAVGGHPLVVGNDDQGQPAGVERVEKPEQLRGGHAVKVAGGLVGEHDDLFVGQGPGDGHPLALAAGERGRPCAVRCVSPTCSSSSVARCRAARGDRPASRAGSSTFSRTVSSSISWKAWNTNPTSLRRRRARARSLISSRRRPASHSSPAVGRSSPPSR